MGEMFRMEVDEDTGVPSLKEEYRLGVEATDGVLRKRLGVLVVLANLLRLGVAPPRLGVAVPRSFAMKLCKLAVDCS